MVEIQKYLMKYLAYKDYKLSSKQFWIQPLDGDVELSICGRSAIESNMFTTSSASLVALFCTHTHKAKLSSWYG